MILKTKKCLHFDPATVSWIKVVGMLPTHPTYLPTHPELSQAGSLKKTHLVLTICYLSLGTLIFNFMQEFISDINGRKTEELFYDENHKKKLKKLENTRSLVLWTLLQRSWVFEGPHPYWVWTFCKWSVCLSVSDPFLIGCEKSCDKILGFWLSWHKFNLRQLKCVVFISYLIFARSVQS